MILDTSAVIAMLREEPGYHRLVARLDDAESLGIGAPTLTETEIVLTARLGLTGRTHLEGFVRENDVLVIPFGEEHSREAARGFLRFGKGRHPAGLNFGDCMTYATARVADEPLLCLGIEFAQTDIDIVRL